MRHMVLLSCSPGVQCNGPDCVGRRGGPAPAGNCGPAERPQPAVGGLAAQRVWPVRYLLHLAPTCLVVVEAEENDDVVVVPSNAPMLTLGRLLLVFGQGGRLPGGRCPEAHVASWLVERYGCDGLQQRNRTQVFFEYPAIASMMVSRCTTGAHATASRNAVHYLLRRKIQNDQLVPVVLARVSLRAQTVPLPHAIFAACALAWTSGCERFLSRRSVSDTSRPASSSGRVDSPPPGSNFHGACRHTAAPRRIVFAGD